MIFKAKINTTNVQHYILAVKPEVEEMQKILRLIARLIVARHVYVWHCKENAPIYT